jgi:acyl-CoA thioesterase-1
VNWLVYHIASGDAFLSGTLLAVAGVFAAFRERRWIRRSSGLLFVVGLLLIGVSATPLPYWFYAAAGLLSVAWLAVGGSEKCPARRKRWLSGLTVGVWLGAAVWEFVYHITPTIESAGSEPIVIFADSLTAGLGENEAETWPRLLNRTQGATIHDFSRVGATTGSLLRKIRATDVPQGIVILEIGGNDILGTTSASQFEAALDECLALLRRSHSQVIMFELPLPPFYNAYGLVQRRLARKHGVALIPKRVLMGVLARGDATLDSIHLAQAGHDSLARIVWKSLGRKWREQM